MRPRAADTAKAARKRACAARWPHPARRKGPRPLHTLCNRTPAPRERVRRLRACAAAFGGEAALGFRCRRQCCARGSALTLLLPRATCAQVHSERVPGKNFRLLQGKPLFHWTLLSLLRAKFITRVVIDTDSTTLEAELAAAFPADADRITVRHTPRRLLRRQILDPSADTPFCARLRRC